MIPYVILFLCYFYVKCYFSEIPSSGASGGRSWRTVAWDRRQWMSRPWGGEILTPVKGKHREERVQLQMSTDGNDWTAAKQETLRSALGELDGNYTSVKLPHRVATCYCMYVWSEPSVRVSTKDLDLSQCTSIACVRLWLCRPIRDAQSRPQT